MTLTKSDIAQNVKRIAQELGFTECGITPARHLAHDAEHLKHWLNKGMHANMSYMENHFDKRTHPSLLVPGAKTIIVVLLNYYPGRLQPTETYQVAKYAYGRDYHVVMKNRLHEFLQQIQHQITPVEGRVFVDSAPVLERALAAEAGLGWIGKNGNLISPKWGSFCFIGELMVDAEMEYDEPMKDSCGSCTRCLQACPTQALVAPKQLDSRKCLSYWTIEHKGPFPDEIAGTLQNRIFGCDICQDVCPWNRKAVANQIADFQPLPSFLTLTKKDWNELSLESFEQLFNQSALARSQYQGLLRNIHAQEAAR